MKASVLTLAGFSLFLLLAAHGEPPHDAMKGANLFLAADLKWQACESVSSRAEMSLP